MDDFATELSRFRSYLKNGSFGDGARLPAEPELAGQLGVTRNRVRRLLKAVESEGLIWRHVGRGTFVGNRSVAESLPALPNQISPLETFEARLLIEPRLAALAAVRAIPAEVDEMRRCVDRMGAIKTFQDWAPLDVTLHRLVAKAARNMLLLTFYETIRECLPDGVKFRIETVYADQVIADTDEEHRAWIDAIADHDPERAEHLMRAHIESVRRRLFGNI